MQRKHAKGKPKSFSFKANTPRDNELIGHLYKEARVRNVSMSHVFAELLEARYAPSEAKGA